MRLFSLVNNESFLKHACSPDILVISLNIEKPVKLENRPYFALVVNVTAESFTFIFNYFVLI